MAVWPVGLVGGLRYEKPYVTNGKVILMSNLVFLLPQIFGYPDLGSKCIFNHNILVAKCNIFILPCIL